MYMYVFGGRYKGENMSNYFSRFKMASCPFEARWLFDPKPDRNLPLWSQKWKENMLQNIRLQRNRRRRPRSDNSMNDSCVKIYLYLRGEKLNYNSCTNLLLRKSQNLLFLAPEVQWALKVYHVCSIHVFFECFKQRPYLVCHVTTIENV